MFHGLVSFVKALISTISVLSISVRIEYHCSLVLNCRVLDSLFLGELQCITGGWMHCRSLIGAAENARRTGKTERLDSDELLNDGWCSSRISWTGEWQMRRIRGSGIWLKVHHFPFRHIPDSEILCRRCASFSGRVNSVAPTDDARQLFFSMRESLSRVEVTGAWSGRRVRCLWYCSHSEGRHFLWEVATLVVCRVDRIRRLGRRVRRAPLSACSNRRTDSPGWHRRRHCSVFSHSSLNTSSTHFLSLHGTTECSWAKTNS